MSVEKLERVLWRLRKNNPNTNKITNHELRRAIMHECGTDPSTYTKNRKALAYLGWIKARKSMIILTNKDLTESS